jgi:hypothetical protein
MGKRGGSQDQGNNFMNIKNGKLKEYSNSYGGDHQNSDGENTSRVHLDILKDPRYFHFSNEFGVGFHEDGSVIFPKLDDFKFDQEKYLKALTYLRSSNSFDPRRRLSQSQLERLYPQDQP